MPDDIELGRLRTTRTLSFRERLTPIRRPSTLSSMSTCSTWVEESNATLPGLTEDETQQQDHLVSFIVGDEIIKGPLATACVWYKCFLRYKFISHWKLFAQTLEGIDDASTAPKPGNLFVVYKFAKIVAQLLKTESNLAVSQVVDELDNQRQLKPQLDGERAIPNQLVFAAIGWLTMFYEAVCDPSPARLEITRTSIDSCGRPHPLTTRKMRSYSQGLDHVTRSFDDFLGKFGDLVPGPGRPGPTERSDSSDLATEDIKVQSVCFNTLQNVIGIDIEWTSSLALHLELDSGKKTLKLFQNPSFCLMMASAKKACLLSRLINDHAANNCEDVHIPDVPADEYFEEMLLTYRLIFGLDDRSWKAFSRLKTVREEQQISGDTAIIWDPLLSTVGAQSATSADARRIYDDLDPTEPAKAYPYAEFPFFGRRLVALQEFVNQHPAQNVRALLNDRRDVAAWYNLISNQVLVFFATFTIFLMILSLIFQVWQVLLAKQQLEQGPQ